MDDDDVVFSVTLAAPWFHITDRGWIAPVRCPIAIKDPRVELVGRFVKIDGRAYRVRSFGTWANGTHAGPWAVGREINLLVEGEPVDEHGAKP